MMIPEQNRPRDKLIIADDHPIFRHGLVELIHSTEKYTVICEADNGKDAFDCIINCKPDIAIVDLIMPCLNGIDLLKRLAKKNIPVRVIILTMMESESYFNDSLNWGAMGYLLKRNTKQELLSCLTAVSMGKHYFCPDMTGYMLERTKKLDSLYQDYPALEKLTSTERHILRLIAEKRTSKEIGNELFISYRTVQNHRANICKKMGLKGYNSLFEFAILNKLLI